MTEKQKVVLEFTEEMLLGSLKTLNQFLVSAITEIDNKYDEDVELPYLDDLDEATTFITTAISLLQRRLENGT